MTATQRVPKPPSRLAGHEGTAAGVVLIAIAVLIAKPWGGGSVAPQPAGSADSSGSAAETPKPTAAGYVFDADVYGPFEPTPEWSLWPAGYFISVRFVTRASDLEADSSPIASDSGATLPAGISPDGAISPDVAPSSSPPTGPDWPKVVDVGAGEHLVWLGINSPRGWSVREAVLQRVLPTGAHVRVLTARLPSRWDDHFTIIAIPTARGAETLSVWPPGDYRLDLVVAPGAIERTIVIRVRTADDPSQEPVLDRLPPDSTG